MSIPSWAKVGAKVLCIDATPSGSEHYDPLPIKGQVYIVAGIPPYNIVDDRPAILIEGCPNRDDQQCVDYGWFLGRFRPVHTLRSDVRAIKSLVREMPASERLSRLEELLNEPEH